MEYYFRIVVYGMYVVYNSSFTNKNVLF